MYRRYNKIIYYIFMLKLTSSMLSTNACYAYSIRLPPYIADLKGAKDSIILTYNCNGKGYINCYEIKNGHMRWQKRMSEEIYERTLTTSTFVCVPNVVILTLSDGTIKQRLDNKKTVLYTILTSDLLVTVSEIKGNNQLITAYDTINFHVKWQHQLKNCDVCGIIPKGDKFDILIADYDLGREIMKNDVNETILKYAQNTDDSYRTINQIVSEKLSVADNRTNNHVSISTVNRCRILTLQASNGHKITQKSVVDFDDYTGDLGHTTDRDLMIYTLPLKIQHFIYSLYKIKPDSNIVIREIRVDNNNDMYFVGKLQSDFNKGTIFAIDGDSGQIIWKQVIPTLELKILAYRDKLYVGSFMADEYSPSKPSKKNKLIALDAKTGKICWMTVVGD